MRARCARCEFWALAADTCPRTSAARSCASWTEDSSSRSPKSSSYDRHISLTILRRSTKPGLLKMVLAEFVGKASFT